MREQHTEKYFKGEGAAKRNERRRLRYAQDPEYRERRRMERRETYRRQHGEPTDGPTCAANIPLIPTLGSEREVHLGGEAVKAVGRVYSVSEVAKLLNRHSQIINRWRNREIFPEPALIDEKGGLYYADVEVDTFVRVMAAHQEVTPHFRKEHEETVAKLKLASFSGNLPLAREWIRERKNHG